MSTWTANAAVSSAEAIEKTGTDGKPHLFCATTPGTSGLVQPTWPASGTVSDDTAVWTATPFSAIFAGAGTIDYASAFIDPAATGLPGNGLWQIDIMAQLGTFGNIFHLQRFCRLRLRQSIGNPTEGTSDIF